jgi:hypothetical protein
MQDFAITTGGGQIVGVTRPFHSSAPRKDVLSSIFISPLLHFERYGDLTPVGKDDIDRFFAPAV